MALFSRYRSSSQKVWAMPMIIALFITLRASAQPKSTQQIQQTWMAYFNQTRFSNKWGTWLDLHLRTKEDWVSNFSQSIIRAGVTYYLNDDARITAGYAYISNYPGDNHKNITQPEHRPWQQFQWISRYPRLRLTQALRLEERFRRKILNDDALADEYSFNFRLRYNIQGLFPLGKKRFQPGTLSLAVGTEAMVNFGKQIVYNYFDQNRFFAGFHYHVNGHDQLQFGYMNVFQQLSAGNQYKNINSARIYYLHTLDLRKNNHPK